MKSDSSLRRLLPFAAYFNICFFWGTAGVANKLSSSIIHPFFAGSLRFLIASVLMALWVGFRHESLAVGLRDGKTLAVGSVLMYFLNTVLLLFASRRVDAGISTVMVSLIPITILLVDSLAARKLCVSWVGIGGIIGGFAGIAVVVVGSVSGGNADPIGIALLLLADIVWSVGTVYLKYQSISASVQVQIFYQSAIPAILFFFCAVLTGNFDLGKLSWRGALPMAYMGIADSIVGLTSYLYLLRRLKTSVVSTYAYINPVVGILLSALLLSEEITMAKVGGMLLILVSVFVIQREDWLSGLLTRKVKRIAD